MTYPEQPRDPNADLLAQLDEHLRIGRSGAPVYGGNPSAQYPPTQPPLHSRYEDPENVYRQAGLDRVQPPVYAPGEPSPHDEPLLPDTEDYESEVDNNRRGTGKVLAIVAGVATLAISVSVYAFSKSGSHDSRHAAGPSAPAVEVMPSASATPSETVSDTPTASETPTSTPTPSPSPSTSASPSPSETPTPSPTVPAEFVAPTQKYCTPMARADVSKMGGLVIPTSWYVKFPDNPTPFSFSPDMFPAKVQGTIDVMGCIDPAAVAVTTAPDKTKTVSVNLSRVNLNPDFSKAQLGFTYPSSTNVVACDLTYAMSKAANPKVAPLDCSKFDMTRVPNGYIAPTAIDLAYMGQFLHEQQNVLTQYTKKLVADYIAKRYSDDLQTAISTDVQNYITALAGGAKININTAGQLSSLSANLPVLPTDSVVDEGMKTQRKLPINQIFRLDNKPQDIIGGITVNRLAIQPPTVPTASASPSPSTQTSN